MAGGIRKDHDCQELRLKIEAESYPLIEAFYLVLLSFLNFSTLPFVIQFQTIKQRLQQAAQRLALKLLYVYAILRFISNVISPQAWKLATSQKQEILASCES